MKWKFWKRSNKHSKENEKLVTVSWIDSRGVTSEWEFKDSLKPLEPSACTTVGFVVTETNSYICLAQTICHDQVLGRLVIPKISITKIIALDNKINCQVKLNRRLRKWK